MKGHMQDGKFHPHTQSKGVRKSRDQSTKSTGVKVRNKRFPPFVTTEEAKKFSDADIERKIKIHQNAVSQQGKDLAQGHGFDKDEHEATINALNLLVSERAIRNIKNRKARDHTGFCPVCKHDITRGSEQEVRRHINDHIKMQEHAGHQGVCDCGIRKKSAIAEEDDFDLAVEKLKKSLLEGLNENEWSKDLQRLKNVTWDVDVTYTGSHGTSDSEYFTITAFYKGVGSVEYQEAFSNDDWFDTSDKKLTKRIETDSDFAEREYNRWLISLFDIYEGAMFEGLVATIEDTYRE